MVPMNRNLLILFSTRIIRLFCYGFLSVVLALYLAQVGLPEQQIGLLFTLTLVGDAGISLRLTTSARSRGTLKRRRPPKPNPTDACWASIARATWSSDWVRHSPWTPSRVD